MSGFILFGSGRAIITQNNVVNPTPFQLVSQKITVAEKSTLVELHGFNQYPIAVGSGKKSVDLTIESATFSLRALGAAYLGQTPTAGGTFEVFGQVFVAPGITVTIAPPNTGTFLNDQGVIYGSGPSNGNLLTRVASAPTAGQYSVNTATGVYTFVAGDGALTLLISYDYTTAVATFGQSILRLNQLIGSAPTCSVAITASNPVTGLLGLLTLPAVTFASMDIMQSDLEKFSMPKLTGKAFAGAANSPWTWSLPDTQ